MSLINLIGAASGIIDGENPEYTADDFREIMPMFGPDIVEQSVVEHFVQMAHAVVKKARWHELWSEGMRLYIAHHLTLYLRSSAPDGADRNGVLNAGGVSGVVTSKAVGGINVSYDINTANGDLAGWAAWKLTTYGTQFATFARMLGHSGMYVR